MRSLPFINITEILPPRRAYGDATIQNYLLVFREVFAPFQAHKPLDITAGEYRGPTETQFHRTSRDCVYRAIHRNFRPLSTHRVISEDFFTATPRTMFCYLSQRTERKMAYCRSILSVPHHYSAKLKESHSGVYETPLLNMK